jgi:hypothetical protein
MGGFWWLGQFMLLLKGGWGSVLSKLASLGVVSG